MSALNIQPISQHCVLWVSHGFGYHGDLMYFGEIFRRFRERVPNMAVVVDPQAGHTPHDGIPLLPIMRLFRRPLSRTTPDGQAYETEVTVPDPRLLWRLLRHDADVLITIEFTLPALVAILARVLSRRKRLVLLVESDPASRGASRHPAVLWIKRRAVRRADVIQTNNAKGRRYLVEDLGADPARVRVAPYLTSRPPGPDRQIAQAPSTPEASPLRLLFANSINARKGLSHLLDAIALLDRQSREHLMLTVVGDGPQRAELEARAAALGMGERIVFVGRRRYAELGEFYAGSDVLVIPSLADYRSLAGFEGLGYGLALLCSVHDGATEETLNEGVNGFAVDPLDPSDFAAKMARLVADRNLVVAMQRASLDLYRTRFSLEVIADNLAESVVQAFRSAT